jgi:hypothetical protein
MAVSSFLQRYCTVDRQESVLKQSRLPVGTSRT